MTDDITVEWAYTEVTSGGRSTREVLVELSPDTVGRIIGELANGDLHPQSEAGFREELKDRADRVVIERTEYERPGGPV